MRITVGHLEVFDDLAFVPDVISGRHNVNAQIEKLLRQRRRDSETSRGILAVGDDEIDGVTLAIAREALTLAAAKLPIKTRFIERIAE